METAIFKEMIGLISREKQRREWLLKGKDPDFAHDQWLFTDAPFVNELYLMLLLTLWHQFERELFNLTARVADDRKEINHQQHQEKVHQLQKGKGHVWDKIKNWVQTKSCKGYKSMETLRLLANSYKHDQSMKPSKKLLKWLKLKTDVNYAPLAESGAFRKGLAEFIGLEKDADYCEITSRFVDITCEFLTKVEKLPGLSRVRPGIASLNPKDFAK
jgi:hypothetical protein